MKMELIPQPLREQVAQRFKLLSEPVRLQLLNLLHVRGEMNVQQLVAATGQQQANVSKHLRQMADGGLLSRRRDGLYVYYAIDDPSLSGLCMLVCSQLERSGYATASPSDAAS